MQICWMTEGCLGSELQGGQLGELGLVCLVFWLRAALVMLCVETCSLRQALSSVNMGPIPPSDTQ